MSFGSSQDSIASQSHSFVIGIVHLCVGLDFCYRDGCVVDNPSSEGVVIVDVYVTLDTQNSIDDRCPRSFDEVWIML